MVVFYYQCISKASHVSLILLVVTNSWVKNYLLICFKICTLALMKSTNPDMACVMPIHMLGKGLTKIPEKNTKMSEINIVQFKI